MKRISLFLLIFVLLITLCSCNDDSTNEKTNPATTPVSFELINQTEADTPYRQEISESGKARIVNRKAAPHLVVSTLLRTDLLINADFLEPEDMEDYFAIAKETGMNTMEIVVMWSQIETAYDVYDYSDLECYLNYAKKYNLKLNIEWYGSFTDGECRSANVPDYIFEDEDKYSMIMDLFDFAHYGRVRIMDWNDDDLLERETKAIYNMMNYVYEWNHANDLYDPIVTVQIGQGVDRFQRWRVSQYKVLDKDGNLYNANDAWAMAHKYLNTVAKGVKYSKYKALTRAEFCEQNSVVNYVRDIANLEFIDIVCPTYLHEISSAKNGIKSFTDEYEDMAVLNVENWATDTNYRHILATFAMGGTGYVSYQLSAPLYVPDSPNGSLYDRYNPEGATLAEKFSEKNTRATDTKMINDALLKAYVPVSNATRKNFAAFGLNNLLNNKTGDERIQKIYFTNGLLLEFSNPQDSIGYAIYDNNCLYVFASKDAELDVLNCNITVAQKGYFDELGEWVNEGAVQLANNQTLSIEAGLVYRIRIANINTLPDMSDLENQGYKSTLDSIRG